MRGYEDTQRLYDTGGRSTGDTAVTGTTVYASRSLRLANDGDVTIQVRIQETTPTVAGTLIVQKTNAPKAVADADARWTTYDLVTPPAISGAMEFDLKITRLKTGRLRLQYTNATGVGVIGADAVRG